MKPQPYYTLTNGSQCEQLLRTIAKDKQTRVFDSKTMGLSVNAIKTKIYNGIKFALNYLDLKGELQAIRNNVIIALGDDCVIVKWNTDRTRPTSLSLLDQATIEEADLYKRVCSFLVRAEEGKVFKYQGEITSEQRAMLKIEQDRIMQQPNWIFHIGPKHISIVKLKPKQINQDLKPKSQPKLSIKEESPNDN